MYQGSEEGDDEGGSEVGKEGEEGALVKIRSIYGEKVCVFEGEELGEEKRAEELEKSPPADILTWSYDKY